MRLRSVGESKLLNGLFVVLLIALVGWIDIATGAEVRILALYLVPLLLAGWRLAMTGAVLSALLAAAVWVGIAYADNAHGIATYVVAINGVTEGAGFVIVAVLVSRLRASFDRERALSRTDELTGLKNRRALFEGAAPALEICQRKSHAVSVICLDLDGFKAANDTHGHRYGDALLRECARILARATRTSDVVARVGGDEFVVFMAETGRHEALALLRRMLAEFEAAAVFREAGVSVSAGLFDEMPAVSSLDELLEHADREMYAVKRGKPDRNSAGR